MSRVPPPQIFTVLIVEDNPLVIALYERALALLAGVRIVVASDGFAGLLQTSEHNPDIIITDLDMPNFDGYQLVRILQADPKHCATRLIVISGLSEAAIALQGGLPPSASFISKDDFSAEGLRSLVTGYLEQMTEPTATIGDSSHPSHPSHPPHQASGD
jgi:CheY-like chemotaxis protein